MQSYCNIIVSGNAIEWKISQYANVTILTPCSGVLKKLRGPQSRKRPDVLPLIGMFKRSFYQLTTLAGLTQPTTCCTISSRCPSF